MTDEVRKPKFEFVAKPRVYGMLDLSYELIVCLVENGRLRPIDYPKSWQEGVNKVGTPAARAYAQKLHDERFPEYPRMGEARRGVPGQPMMRGARTRRCLSQSGRSRLPI